MTLALALSGLLAWWVLARARLGSRVRSLAGVRLRTADRLTAAAARVPPLRLAASGLGGFLAGGLWTAAAACVCVVVAEPFLRARTDRKMRARIDEQLPDVLRAIASAMRAGRSVPSALDVAREGAAMPIRSALDHAVRRLEVGAPADDAIDAFARVAGTDAARAAAETLRIGRAAGGDLPAMLDVTVASLAERARLDGERRAATAQARLSGLVVGAMPLAFFVMAGSAARKQALFLVTEPLGWALLVLGLGLELGGALWMRALLR